MAVYAIILPEPEQGAWDRIEAKWPGRTHIYDERLAFVCPEEIMVTRDIADIVGMEEERRVTGFVLDIKAYAGWANPSVWEWIQKFL